MVAMQTLEDIILDDLNELLRSVGQDGGLVSPSVYDTARVLRYAPPQDLGPALRWLLEAQHPDGGWGLPAVPAARDIPTLAALITLHQHPALPGACAAVERGLRFIQGHHIYSNQQQLGDDIPVAAELILPQLLDEAAQLGLEVPAERYNTLRLLGNARRQIIRKLRPGAGTAPSHCWEAWGAEDLDLIDGSGSVGHSPAATAAWLSQAPGHPAAEQAHTYLRLAGRATETGIPGVVPTVWPIQRFEQAWLLYALYAAGLLGHPALRPALDEQLKDMFWAIRPEGLGMSDHFIYDGDITGASIAVLAAAGHLIDPQLIRRFQKDDHFFTYAHELQPSLTTTAHAIVALARLGEQVAGPASYLIERQSAEGLFLGDKWHSSYLYTTSQCLLALLEMPELAARSIVACVQALLQRQHAEGGWGINGPSAAETAYAIHALLAVRRRARFEGELEAPLARAREWLSTYYLTGRQDESRPVYWIGKELYCPARVDQAFLLSALLALHRAVLDVPSVPTRRSATAVRVPAGQR